LIGLSSATKGTFFQDPEYATASPSAEADYAIATDRSATYDNPNNAGADYAIATDHSADYAIATDMSKKKTSKAAAGGVHLRL
jgi:hypothetical protein